MTRRMLGLVPTTRGRGIILSFTCLLLLVLASYLVACDGSTATSTTPSTPTATATPGATLPAPTSIPTPPAAPTPAPNGTIAPDFVGIDVVTNETISLSQFSGSKVLLNFVNYGCSRSLNEVVGAQLLAIRDLREQRDDFIPLSIFCGCCSSSVLREFTEQNDLVWPWILDTGNSIVSQYYEHLRQYGYPTLVFIDEAQNIREVSGYVDISALDAKIDGI